MDRHSLTNNRGNTIAVLNHGATLHSIVVDGHEMLLQHPTLDDYRENFGYLGACVGRYANRVAGARFELDGKTHQLLANEGVHQLHGGPEGFSARPWTLVLRAEAATQSSLTFYLLSPAGDQGFPGELEVTCRYHWHDDDRLEIVYEARTDAPTVINLTNHAYFNLGDGPDILDHLVELRADHYTPVRADGIPTGEIASVAGTPFDFRTPKPIRQDLEAAGGYDHNFVIGPAAERPRVCAVVTDPASGRRLTCATTEPGVQFWTANFGPGQSVSPHAGFCLETQHFPDSPNEPAFPSTVLRPGDTFRSRTEYRFDRVSG